MPAFEVSTFFGNPVTKQKVRVRNMLLDTGSEVTVIPSTVAMFLGLPIKGIGRILGVVGSSTMTTGIHDVEVWLEKAPSCRVLMEVVSIPSQVSLLGFDFLRRVKARIAFDQIRMACNGVDVPLKLVAAIKLRRAIQLGQQQKKREFFIPTPIFLRK